MAITMVINPTPSNADKNIFGASKKILAIGQSYIGCAFINYDC